MRRFYLGALVAVAVVVVLAILFLSQSSPARPSNTVLINTSQSGCIAHQNQFNCTLLLTSKQGALSTSQVSSVTINDTVARVAVMTSGNGSLIVKADIQITTLSKGLNDVNNVPPVSSGALVVYLKDGTTVSVTLPGEYQE